ncbi:hypothetical protein BDN72DRAFT_797047 [Pluteus cervinus]|uniref:Uncharacterized protein n=1 Tax=Pluteus cervinus TaxID=181527 RepID=A0ACD3ATV9_9AGAR|nr:hypothetical protein BDN72DRAFT_797047 [Pluteus cervinus]
MANQVPMPIPEITEPERWRPGDPHRYNVLNDQKDQWEALHKMVERHDEEMCDAWKDELDKLLISAGLFTAAMTAFAVESYQWLEDPRDTNTTLLAHISLQLGNDSTTSAIVSAAMKPYSPSASAVRINVFWFLSLTLSLSTVLIGILCTQWLREYQRDVDFSYRDALAVRQIRYRGLVAWKVPEIVSALPVTLQIALVLFFAGLFDLLFQRHRGVALTILVPMLVTASCLFFTTFAPTFQRLYWAGKQMNWGGPLLGLQCPYKSPQSWIFLRVVSFCLFLLRLIPTSRSTAKPVTDPRKSAFEKNPEFFPEDWAKIDQQWRNVNAGDQDLILCFEWIRRHLCQGFHGFCYLYHCFTYLGPAEQKAIISRSGDEGVEECFALLKSDPMWQREFATLRFVLMDEDLRSPRVTFLSRSIVERWIRLALAIPKSHDHMHKMCDIPAIELGQWLRSWEPEVQGIFTIQLLVHSTSWTEYIVDSSKAEYLAHCFFSLADWTLGLNELAWEASRTTLVWAFIHLKDWFRKHPAISSLASPEAEIFLACVNKLHVFHKRAAQYGRADDQGLSVVLAHSTWAALSHLKNLEGLVGKLDRGVCDWLKVSAIHELHPEDQMWFWKDLPRLSQGKSALRFPPPVPELYSPKNSRSGTLNSPAQSQPNRISYVDTETAEPESDPVSKPLLSMPLYPQVAVPYLPDSGNDRTQRTEPFFFRDAAGFLHPPDGPPPGFYSHSLSDEQNNASGPVRFPGHLRLEKPRQNFQGRSEGPSRAQNNSGVLISPACPGFLQRRQLAPPQIHHPIFEERYWAVPFRLRPVIQKIPAFPGLPTFKGRGA